MTTLPSPVAEPNPLSHPGNAPAGRIKSWLLPSISDVLFIVFLVLLFVAGNSWWTLLRDGDTGWHIRTGEYILRTHTVPVRDMFSFLDPGTPWYAFEWLADVILAALHQFAGLKGVVLLSGAVICLTSVILFRHMIWRGVSLHVAVLTASLAANTLQFHYLARPHIFTTLFFVIALWMLDRDWSRPSPAAWLLVPLTILWTNLHGGFLILLVALGCFAISALLQRDPRRFKRYAVMAAACLAATLINPYGWQLHWHIWTFLRADWLVHIQEWSPVSASGLNLRFEIFLILGLSCTMGLLRRRRYHEALLIAFWAHNSLTAVRHVTMYVVVAAPPIAEQLSLLWKRWTRNSTRRSVKRVLRDVVDDMRPAARRTSVWVPVVLVLLAVGNWGVEWPTDFPASSFPTELIARNAGLLNGPGHEGVRILSPDIWGGYLSYKFYPNRHTFMDGRFDYFGAGILKDYFAISSASDNWPQLDARYGWQLALIPPDWPLALVLKQSPAWVLRDQDKVALLFERLPNGEQK